MTRKKIGRPRKPENQKVVCLNHSVSREALKRLKKVSGSKSGFIDALIRHSSEEFLRAYNARSL